MDERGLRQALQAARQAAGLTQQQLCGLANLSFSTLTKISAGPLRPPRSLLSSRLPARCTSAWTIWSANLPCCNLTKTKRGVSFIYFDVNGCLVHFYQRAFAEISRLHDIPSDIVETAFWHYNDDACRGVLTLTDFNAKLAERLGVKSIDWQKHYLETVEPITEMQDLLKWAAERYKVGLLTNIMPGLLGAMIRSQIVPNLQYDAIIDSSR